MSHQLSFDYPAKHLQISAISPYGDRFHEFKNTALNQYFDFKIPANFVSVIIGILGSVSLHISRWRQM